MAEPPSVGDRLRDTVAGSRQLIQGDCLGVVSPLEQRVYGDARPRAVTYATESSLSFGVVAVDSSEAAHRLFEAFATDWQACRGLEMVKADGAYIYEHEITEVDMTADVLSGLVEVTSDSPTGVPVRVERAVGVAKDCIVEASVSVTDPPTTRGSSNAAVELVNAMLARVRATRP